MPERAEQQIKHDKLCRNVKSPDHAACGLSAILTERCRKIRCKTGQIVEPYMKITDEEQGKADGQQNRGPAVGLPPGMEKIQEQKDKVEQGSRQKEAAFYTA